MKIKLNKLLSLPFLALLAISTVLWLTERLSHRYTTQIEIPIDISTDFDSQVWIENGAKSVRCMATASGRQLLSYKMGIVPRIPVPVSLLTLKDNIGNGGDQYIYTVTENSLEKALMQVQNNITINMITDTMPSIRVSHMMQKRVKIVARTAVSCSKGYMLDGGVRLSVDSIDIKAPLTVLDTLSVIYTEPIVIKDLHSPQSGSAELSIPSYVVVQDNIKIRYEVNAVPYSEKRYSVPIEVAGHPDALAIPTKAEVRLKVPLAGYAKITAPIVTIDPRFTNRSGYYPIRVSEVGHGAVVVSVTPSMAQYLIEKQTE